MDRLTIFVIMGIRAGRAFLKSLAGIGSTEHDLFADPWMTFNTSDSVMVSKLDSLLLVVLVMSGDGGAELL